MTIRLCTNAIEFSMRLIFASCRNRLFLSHLLAFGCSVRMFDERTAVFTRLQFAGGSLECRLQRTTDCGASSGAAVAVASLTRNDAITAIA